ncbi:MAG: hypothetical protein ACYCO0_01505 [Candidatus Micrarchaeaceae archaeon]
MKATYCIICGKQKHGIPIKNDRVLEAIRWFKRNVTKNEKGNNLAICRECYPEYRKRRDRYTSRQAIYVIMGVIFLILGAAIQFKASTVMVGILLLIALYGLSLLNYTPALSIKDAGKRATGNTSNK